MSADRVVTGRCIPDCIDEILSPDRCWEVLRDSGESTFDEVDLCLATTLLWRFHLLISAKWVEDSRQPDSTGALWLVGDLLIFSQENGRMIGSINSGSDLIEGTFGDCRQRALELWPALRDRLQHSIDAIKEL